jgi:ferredoxin
LIATCCAASAWAVCPNLAFLTYRQKPLELALPVLVVKQGALVAGRTARRYRVEQRFQVCVLTDFCNECGNCVTFCPPRAGPGTTSRGSISTAPNLRPNRTTRSGCSATARLDLMQARWAGKRTKSALNHDLRYHAPGVKLELDAKTFAVRKASASLSEGTSAFADAVRHHVRPVARAARFGRLCAGGGVERPIGDPMKTLLIKNGTVVTLDEHQQVIEGGEVLIEGSTIARSDISCEAKHKVDRVIDARGGVIMPGLINVHHHLYSTFARGFACPGEPAGTSRKSWSVCGGGWIAR